MPNTTQSLETSPFRLAALFSILAGLTDTATGLLLVSSPTLTLKLMAIDDVTTSQLLGGGVLLRFIGVFVGAIGLSYLYPWVLGWQDLSLLRGKAGLPDPRLLARLTSVFEITCLIRIAVAIFVAVAIALGDLSIAWISVSATDLVYALFQAGVLRKGWLSQNYKSPEPALIEASA